jgi:UDP-N-acetylmuramoyl-L-alanyl-D-glutamate--2,6-diaminopimelate ligase
LTGFVNKTLPDLCSGLPVEIITCSELPGVQITGVTSDSREVKLGYVFVAIEGLTTDGHRFIPQAVTQGAAAVIGTHAIEDLPVPYVQVADAREALAYLAAAFYGYPARALTVIGVTGTDGKTTTANLIYQVLMSAGLPTGMVSTVNAMVGQEVYDTGFHVTTPDATEVQRYLARMKAAGLTHAILETTSHGLAQHRVTGCEFDIAVLTNITHEHLDAHGTFTAYREAKAGLFTGLARRAPKAHGHEPLAVLNRDDDSYEYLRERVTVRQVAYSIRGEADVWATGLRHTASGLQFIAHGPGFETPIECSLMGTFNASNCLAAIAATVVGLGADPQAARLGIQRLPGVPGRMEQIFMGQSFIAMVDFAHTPNALRQALTAVREMAEGRVIAVFGSAGLRDRQKRRLMAEVAAGLADFTILTAEDPRTEPLETILEEMAQGLCARGKTEGSHFLRVPDRGAAIRQAVRMARAGDLVIACGKGHEQSMCFGVTEYPWDDRMAMRAALAELLSATGPRMPYLPTQDAQK